ncbi:MAG: SRPBCC family protein, partial [Luminiphilus sp.]
MTEDEKLAVDPDAIVRSVTVQIAAPAQAVWDVLVDFGRYREWNPFCVEASGVLEVGEP